MSSQPMLSSLREAFDAEPFGRSLGLRAKSASASSFVSMLGITPSHQIEPGTFVHGGCLAAICEQTNQYAALTLLPDQTRVLTTSLQTSYLAGAAGHHLSCHANVVAAASYGLVVDCSVYTGAETADRLVASCRSMVMALGTGSPPWPGTAWTDMPLSRASSPAANDCGALVPQDYSLGWRRFCGMRPARATVGHMELAHDIDAHHLDESGGVLAGLIAPFADETGGACAYTTGRVGERMATLDLSLNFLHRPVRASALLGRAWVVKAGRSVVVSKVEVFGLTPRREELLATSMVTVTRVPGHERLLRQLSASDAGPAPAIASPNERVS